MKTVPFCLAVAAVLTASNGVAFAECQCLANGQTFEQGQVACLMLPSGSQLARCEMVLNNSSRTKIQDGCPQATDSSTDSPADLASAAPPPDTVKAY